MGTSERLTARNYLNIKIVEIYYIMGIVKYSEESEIKKKIKHLKLF